MIGIYKITNLKNGKVYIGQSRQTEKRFQQHKTKAKFLEKDRWYNQLYIDMYSLGVENFSFEIIEECTIEELNEKEEYWIKYYNSQEDGYNITSGGDCTGKLSSDDVESIIKLLQEKLLSIDDIANKYGVSDTTIRNINRGDEFYKLNLKYPIRSHNESINIYLKNNNIIKNKNYKDGKYFCPICGNEITNRATTCRICYNIKQRKVKNRPSKEELLNLIKTKSFIEIGNIYNVSDSTIKKWCKLYQLPHRKKDINKML